MTEQKKNPHAELFKEPNVKLKKLYDQYKSDRAYVANYVDRLNATAQEFNALLAIIPAEVSEYPKADTLPLHTFHVEEEESK